jgi:alkaline phosphatase
LTDLPLQDHETGGLAVARRKFTLCCRNNRLTGVPELHATYPGYLWYPGVLANASNSASHLAQRLKAEIATSSFKSDDLKKHINKEYIQRGLGIEDATEAELQLIVEIGWSTHGHTAVDVNIYGTVGSSILRGNHENTDVGKFLREYLDVNVDAVTEELNKKSKALNKMDVEAGWTGKIPTGEELQIVLQHHEETYGKSP